MVLKTEVEETTGFFRGKECINENLNTWFFPRFERKTAQSSVIFFLAICQKAIYDCSGALRGKDKIWEKFSQLWHKFVAWVSILVLRVQGNIWGRKCLKNFIFSHVLVSSKLFSFLVNLFFGRVTNHAIYVSGDVFSRNDFFEGTLCLYNFFQSLNWKNLDFCQLFRHRCQNCILRAQRNIRGKTCSSKTIISTLFLIFEPHKLDSEKRMSSS